MVNTVRLAANFSLLSRTGPFGRLAAIPIFGVPAVSRRRHRRNRTWPKTVAVGESRNVTRASTERRHGHNNDSSPDTRESFWFFMFFLQSRPPPSGTPVLVCRTRVRLKVQRAADDRSTSLSWVVVERVNEKEAKTQHPRRTGRVTFSRDQVETWRA